jgi:hypothetical protein
MNRIYPLCDFSGLSVADFDKKKCPGYHTTSHWSLESELLDGLSGRESRHEALCERHNAAGMA